ncbi:F167A protein, partial [Leucopsar rothschildi]|nr:F167A protein [Leucopsar rothschildi]
MALSQLKFKELGEEEPTWEQENLDSVKALTAKLKLQTRRPSYLEWEARVRGQRWGARTPGGTWGAPQSSGHPEEQQGGGVCGFATMEAALEWLRTELACHQHKERLDDATFGLEGCEEDSDLLCTIPPKAAFLLSTPLKHIGVTRMNINSRRFSLC